MVLLLAFSLKKRWLCRVLSTDLTQRTLNTSLTLPELCGSLQWRSYSGINNVSSQQKLSVFSSVVCPNLCPFLLI